MALLGEDDAALGRVEIDEMLGVEGTAGSSGFRGRPANASGAEILEKRDSKVE